MDKPMDQLTGWLKVYLSNWDMLDEVSQEWARFCIKPSDESLGALRARLDELGLVSDYFDRHVEQYWGEYKRLFQEGAARSARASSLKLVYKMALSDEQGFEFMAPSLPDVADMPFRSAELQKLVEILIYGEQIVVVTGFPRQDLGSYIVPGLMSHFRGLGKDFFHSMSGENEGVTVAKRFMTEGPADVLALDWREGMEFDNDLINVLQYGLLMDPFRKLVLVVEQERLSSNRRMAERVKPLMSRVVGERPYEIPAMGIFPKFLNIPQAARHLFGEELLPHHFGMAHQVASNMPLLIPYLDWVKEVAARNREKVPVDRIVIEASGRLGESLPRGGGEPISLVSETVFNNMSRGDRIRQPHQPFELFSLLQEGGPPRDPDGGGPHRDSFGGVVRARDSGIEYSGQPLQESTGLFMGARPNIPSSWIPRAPIYLPLA